MQSYEMIMCIVNAGFSELVMDAAKEEGAFGGTVIHARGTANKEAEQFFHIAIQPDKDIVLILVPIEIKDNILHAIYRNAGLKSEGKGIAFSLPVDEVVGISAPAAALVGLDAKDAPIGKVDTETPQPKTQQQE
ncbi:MAG: P-II family nitrogen regulator [Clostridia bacterium]|nr:P-II family nitrogen regulator [Clostridia bacterium]MDE7329158.1 P-II family nitrogen regulator [Clostridia bacterium]